MASFQAAGIHLVEVSEEGEGQGRGMKRKGRKAAGRRDANVSLLKDL